MNVPTISRGWRAFVLVLGAFLGVLPAAAGFITFDNFDTSGLKPSILGPSTDALLNLTRPAIVGSSVSGSHSPTISGGQRAVFEFNDSMASVALDNAIASPATAAESDAGSETMLANPEYFTDLALNSAKTELDKTPILTLAQVELSSSLEELVESVPPIATITIGSVATALAIFLAGSGVRRKQRARN